MDHLSTKENNLFVLFICHVDNSQTMVPLVMLLILFERHQWVHKSNDPKWFHIVSTYNLEVIEYQINSWPNI
jgi:hypothetical protein